jgi:hypothetical protein
MRTHIVCTIAYAYAASLLLIDNQASALSIGRRSRPFRSKKTLPPPQPIVDDTTINNNNDKPVPRKRRRRKRDFQLNYKTDDDDADYKEKKRLRRVLFRLGKTLNRHRAGEEVVLDVGNVQEVQKPREVRLRHLENGQIVSSFVDVAEQDVPSITANDGKKDATSFTTPANIVGKRIKKKKQQVVVTNIHELREAILDKGVELRDVELQYSTPPSLLSSNSSISNMHRITNTSTMPYQNSTALFSHDVLNLLHERYHSHSTPANRSDTHKLALTIEGGGMRGAVSGGMAAAIVCLGLSNAFDSIYGSSAGSIIGSYFVSRQLYLDVYTDVIPAGFDLFVSKAKIIGDIFRNLFTVMRGGSMKRLNGLLVERFKIPRNGIAMNGGMGQLPTREGGLNISFVLDSIMCPERGLRPLDLEAFAHNDEVQPLRIVGSAVEVETGRLKSVVFGSKEGHFNDGFANHLGEGINSTALYPEILSAEADEQGYRRGLWACLGASMSVPGAAGPPFRMDLSSINGTGTSPHLCFDAFCYEPIPFRSAVAEGATHVLALRSRPAGFEPKTKPTLYERAVAPLYFRSNGVETVAKFFEGGGQQYLYAEDVLMCDEGLDAKGPIRIPPAEVLYANPVEKSIAVKDRSNWAEAHLLPITVPADVPELGTLSDSRDEILIGIRSGFAAVSESFHTRIALH